MSSKSSDVPPPVESPCVRNCCLNLEDVCVGCGRTLEEIKKWSSLDKEQKRVVLQKAQERLSGFSKW